MQVTFAECLASFSQETVRLQQEDIFRGITAVPGSVTVEAPMGVGKTDVAMAVLRARAATVAQELRDRSATDPHARPHPRWFIAPTKVQVDQVKRQFPEVEVVYGRNEYPCAYYHARGEPLSAADVPCSTLRRQKLCPHAVDVTTGTPQDPTATPCEYLHAKYTAKSGGIIVATHAFFLTSAILARDWESPDTVVIDEAHQIEHVAGRLFATHITETSLRDLQELLTCIGDTHHAEIFREFLVVIQQNTSRKPGESKLLEQDQTERLIQLLERTNYPHLDERIRTALTTGALDPVHQRAELTVLEDLTRNILRYLRHLRFAVTAEQHPPRNLVFAYAVREREDGAMVARLVIEPYAVSGLIRSAVGSHVLAMSATIGSAALFGQATGLSYPVVRIVTSPFPIAHRRLYLPTDTPDLAFRAQGRTTLRDTAIQILSACAAFRAQGHRSLIVVVSHAEQKVFQERASDAGLHLLSCGNGMNAREVIARFTRGEGDGMLGTTAQFAEGIDLPRRIAPVIIALRPNYQNPNDPRAQFERQQRYAKGRAFALQRWRVTITALQTSGRNIRTPEDVGITIFVSRQYRDLFPQGLPPWMAPAYVTTRSLAQIVQESLALLQPATKLPLAAGGER
ncbi:hypothetical protein HY632_04050 [Candidatus Uhrbacteria bacterium]|nr:hypothetical protein [Candidatus Uhrbacteria bacterium]